MCRAFFGVRSYSFAIDIFIINTFLHTGNQMKKVFWLQLISQVTLYTQGTLFSNLIKSNEIRIIITTFPLIYLLIYSFPYIINVINIPVDFGIKSIGKLCNKNSYSV